MDLTFTGRDLQVTDEIRETAEPQARPIWSAWSLAATRIDLEFIAEHYPRLDGVKRVEAALHIPRKTFRAHAEADDVPTALDRVAEQARAADSAIITASDGHPCTRRALESAQLEPGACR